VDKDNEDLPLADLLREPEFAGLKQNTARVAAGKGRLEAKRRGRDWWTTRRALRTYLATQASPSKRGPKLKRGQSVATTEN
jgi:hypothetical protein